MCSINVFYWRQSDTQTCWASLTFLYPYYTCTYTYLLNTVNHFKWWHSRCLSFLLFSHILYSQTCSSFVCSHVLFCHLQLLAVTASVCVCVCVCECVSVVKSNSDTGSLVCRSDNERDHTVSRNNSTKAEPSPLVERKLTRGLTDSFISPAKCSHNWWVSHDTEIGHFSYLLFSFSLFVSHIMETCSFCTYQRRHKLRHYHQNKEKRGFINLNTYSLCKCFNLT